MRMSKLFLPTLKEVPKDATIDSHILMLRAGMIKKSASGLYAMLPLGHRVMKKVREIVCQEMDKIGAQEFCLPILTSRELWEESGRYDKMGDLMFRLKDRHAQDFVLGPTHEESFTDIIRSYLKSYRQLPIIVYQVQQKFRDEIRPRYGVMRGREFVMKDAYSFHADASDLDKTYEDFRVAYRRFFLRCGLDTVAVSADSGAMGGSGSEEFMVRSHIGEDTIIECAQCGYVANIERAESLLEKIEYKEGELDLQEVETPKIKKIEQLAEFFKLESFAYTLKTLIYKDKENNFYMVLIRGDLEVNEVKLSNVLGGAELFLADDKDVYDVTGAPVGFAGPVNPKMKVKMIADLSVKEMKNFIIGANKKDYHYLNANLNRDFTVDEYADIRLAKSGDNCSCCKDGVLKSFEGIEVGHIFKLGYKYTKEMGVQFLDSEGNKPEPIMGCYGVGIDRTIATVIEQNNDKDGIIWPLSIAPYKVILLPLTEEGDEIATNLYDELWEQGIETLLEDRDLRPGAKFKDADLIGIPIRVTFGKRSLEQGKAELKIRTEKEASLVDLASLKSEIQKIIEEDKKQLQAKLNTVNAK